MKKRTILIIAIMAAVALILFLLFNGVLFPQMASPDADMAEMEEKVEPAGPAFSADSAYAFIQAQCNFGYRDMNSAAHDRCGDWIEARFRQYGCQVKAQHADLKGYDGTILRSRNIIASFNPKATTRILLCAHWDSRPWADNDPDSLNWRKPVLAANDGASGVAVMLEIARLLSSGRSAVPAYSKDGAATSAAAPQATPEAGKWGETLPFGVDFVCFDAEDWGTPQWADVADDAASWALGAQYWAQNAAGYEARYGILLDMVGGQGAKFYQEGMSKRYAPEIVKKVWRAARKAGYGSYFPRSEGGYITDDHVPVNEIARIPTIDIIPYYPNCPQSSFGPTWHTLADDMEHIDKNTLKAVGQTVIQVLFTEE